MGTNYQLIDSGGFGCVIKPPVTSDSNIIKTIVPYVTPHATDVSKIFKMYKKDDFYNELQIAYKMQQIDPTFKFTVKMKGAQKIKSNVFDKFSHIDVCVRKKHLFDKKKDAYYQMIMENGGKSIDRQHSHFIAFKQLLKLLRTFLSGMVIFQKKGYVHNDIKPGNVLLKKDKLSLIDFSLLIKDTETFSIQTNYVLSRFDYYYSPEYYIYYIVSKNAIPFRKQNVLFALMQDGAFNRFSDFEFNSKYKGDVIDFLNVVEKKVARGTSISSIFDKKLALKSDVFSFSFVLQDMLNRNIIIFDNNEQMNFFKQLTSSCRNGNPYKRPSFKELYHIVNRKYSQLNKS